MTIPKYLIEAADYVVDRLKEPFTWRGLLVIGSVLFGFNFDPEIQLLIMSIGVAVASSIDILPDSFISKQNNKKVQKELYAQLEQALNYRLGYSLPGEADKQEEGNSKNRHLEEDTKVFDYTEISNRETSSRDGVKLAECAPYLICMARQQQILAYLGYYKGKIDGVWGNLSKEAMLLFENTSDFYPADKTNGEPLSCSKTIPNILFFNEKTGSLHVRGVCDEDLPVCDQNLVNKVLVTPPKNFLS